jgi:hypothetical protein
VKNTYYEEPLYIFCTILCFHPLDTVFTFVLCSQTPPGCFFAGSDPNFDTYIKELMKLDCSFVYFDRTGFMENMGRLKTVNAKWASNILYFAQFFFYAFSVLVTVHEVIESLALAVEQLACELYTAGARFGSRPRHWLFILKFLEVFHSPSKRMPG